MLALTELTGAAGRMSPESQPLTRCGSPRLLRAQPRTRLLKILILGAARAPASATASPGHCAEDPMRTPHGASVTPAHSLGAGLRSACRQAITSCSSLQRVCLCEQALCALPDNHSAASPRISSDCSVRLLLIICCTLSK